MVFLERLVTGARHVEVQVIADGQGTAWALGVRDCSVQRRNQKVIEESASPVLAPEQAAELKASAERLAVAVGYRGAATVEFLYHPGDRLFAFLEVNTRLQVEHPITEATTGFDLVKAQLHVAGGGRLTGEPPVERGHAIEARLNAEDPDRDFAPSPGRITRLDLPAGPGIRVDTGVSEGDTIPADFDSMIAKIIAYGRDRDEALGRLRRAMANTTVVIAGGATNKSFVLDLLDQPEVIDASADTGWIDRVRGEGRLVAHRHSAVALAAAAIEAYEEDETAERQRLLSTAAGGRPQVQHRSGRPLDLKLRGVTYRMRVARVGAHRFRVGVEAGGDVRTADVELDRFDRHTGQIAVNGARFRLLTDTHGPVHLVEVDGVTHRISRDEGGVVRSPMPALVVATPLAVGAEVEAGAPVLVLEAMKMETVLRAPFRARLKESSVQVGTQVEAGAPLLRLEPLVEEGAEAADGPAGPAVELDLPAPAADVPARSRAERGQEDLCALLLGYDVDPHDERRVLDDYLDARRAATEAGHRPLAEELELVGVFADLAELSRNRPGDDGPAGHVHSAREYFHTYLQSLDVERAGSPDCSGPACQGARPLRCHRAGPLPELEAAVFRIFLALQRAAADATVIAALLRSWLREPPPDEALREPAGLTLERLVAATQVRFPVVADLARGVVFAWFAQPLLRRNRARVYARVRAHLRHLDTHPDAPDRADRVAEMVRSTEPLVRLLGQRLVRDDLDNATMLEVLTRRYYGNKALTEVTTRATGGCTFVVAGRDGSSVVSAAVRFDALGDALRGLAEVAGERDAVDADVYLSWENQPEDFDATAAALLDVLNAHPLPAAVRRITTTVAGRGGAVMHHHFTFRPVDAGITEERLIRGLHPPDRAADAAGTAAQLRPDPAALGRRGGLPVPLRGTANPADERLVALAQVRDLTPLRDHEGRLVDAAPRPRHAGRLPGRDPQGESRPPTRRFSTPTGSSSTSGRRARSAAPELNTVAPSASCPPRRAPGWRRSCSWPGQRDPRTRRAGRHRGADQLRGRPGCAAGDRRAADRAGRAAGRLPARRCCGPAAAAPSTRTS